MIIEFPKKYDVRMFGGTGGGALISLPTEYKEAATELFRQQPWINGVDCAIDSMLIYISRAYEISDQQAHAALCQLCEHVMSPPVEVDREVWGDALGEVGG